jgi:hypothetical protein
MHLTGGRARPRPSKGGRTLRPPFVKTLYSLKSKKYRTCRKKKFVGLKSQISFQQIDSHTTLYPPSRTKTSSLILYEIMRWRSTIRSIWKVIFAIAAILEIQFITILMRSDDKCRSTPYFEDDEFSINYTYVDRAWESTFTLSQGPFFCCLCIVEALVRAVEARKAALDNRALDELERSLLRAAQISSTKLSMFFLGAVADQNHKKRALTTVSKVLRTWIPAIATIAFWLFILPIDVADVHVHCGSVSLNDSSVAAHWINRMLLSFSAMTSAFYGLLESFFWTNILPFRIHKEPQRFVQRLQVILRWIRFIRFAGPLFRMVSYFVD